MASAKRWPYCLGLSVIVVNFRGQVVTYGWTIKDRRAMIEQNTAIIDTCWLLSDRYQYDSLFGQKLP